VPAVVIEVGGGKESLSLMRKTTEALLAIISLDSMVAVSEIECTSKGIKANLLRTMEVPAYENLSTIQNGFSYVTDQKLKRHLSKYIVLL